MALNVSDLAHEIKAAVKLELETIEVQIEDLATMDAFYLGIAKAVIAHFQANAEVVGAAIQ